MRELDLVLVRYLDADYPTADLVQREAFEALLDLPDPVILDYLLGRVRPDDECQRQLVERFSAPRT